MVFNVFELPDGSGYSGLSIGSYAENIQALNAEGFTPASIKEIARHRIALGIFHEISWTGTRTTDLFVYKDDTYYLAHGDLRSLLFDSEASQHVENYNINHKEVAYFDGYIKDAVEIPVEGVHIHRNELHEHEVGKFLFGDLAGPYARFLAHASIPVLSIIPPSYTLASNYPEDFVRPLILRCTDNWSGIITANADLYTEYGFRGFAKEYSGPHLSQEETFSPEQLEILKPFVTLQPGRPYGLSELLDEFRSSPYKTLFNPLLRFMRNGAMLPASYDTWYKEK